MWMYINYIFCKYIRNTYMRTPNIVIKWLTLLLRIWGSRIKSRPRDRVSGLRFSMVFLNPKRLIPG
jgi:hypothetical protein